MAPRVPLCTARRRHEAAEERLRRRYETVAKREQRERERVAARQAKIAERQAKELAKLKARQERDIKKVLDICPPTPKAKKAPRPKAKAQRAAPDRRASSAEVYALGGELAREQWRDQGRFVLDREALRLETVRRSGRRRLASSLVDDVVEGFVAAAYSIDKDAAEAALGAMPHGGNLPSSDERVAASMTAPARSKAEPKTKSTAKAKAKAKAKAPRRSKAKSSKAPKGTVAKPKPKPKPKARPKKAKTPAASSIRVAIGKAMKGYTTARLDPHVGGRVRLSVPLSDGGHAIRGVVHWVLPGGLWEDPEGVEPHPWFFEWKMLKPFIGKPFTLRDGTISAGGMSARGEHNDTETAAVFDVALDPDQPTLGAPRPAGDVGPLLRYVLQFVSDDEARTNLVNPWIAPVPVDHVAALGEFAMVATDGHRLGAVGMPPAWGDQGMILPRRAVELAATLGIETVALSPERNACAFQLRGGVYVRGKAPGATTPPYGQVIPAPKRLGWGVAFDGPPPVSTWAGFKAIGLPDVGVRIQRAGGTFNLLQEVKYDGDRTAEATLEGTVVRSAEEPNAFAVRWPYLRDAMNTPGPFVFSAMKATKKDSTPHLNPLVVSGDGFVGVVMPVRM